MMMNTMQLYEISQWGCALYLGVLAILDWKMKKIPLGLIVIGMVFGCGFQLIYKELPFLLVVTGGAVGLVFLAVSKVTEEAFGYGDSMVIGVLGIYLGFWNLLSMLVLTFILAAMTAMYVLTKQKFHRKSVLPFVPFLACSYILILLTGGF